MRNPRRALPPDRRAARLVARRSAVHLLPADAPDLSAGAGLHALRDVLRSHAATRLPCVAARGGTGSARADEPFRELPELRAAARLIAGEARALDPVRAERLLIALKAVWAALPEVQMLPPGGPREAFRDRLVACCIEEFYSPTTLEAPTPPGSTAAA